MNKDALLVISFWILYHEILSLIMALGLGINWLYFQIPVILMSLLMFALTSGSQTKMDREWNEND